MKRVIVVGLIALAPVLAKATMQSAVVYTAEGAGLSIDAVGTTGTGLVQAEIPANASIHRAYLYSASVWSTALYDVKLDGNTLSSTAASRLDVGAKEGNGAAENRWDVTGIVNSKYNPAGGIFDFEVQETGYLDGEVLAVLYSVAGNPTQTAMIFDGELAVAGDSFSVGLNPAFDGSDVIMSLGISYGYQAGYGDYGQYSRIDVNGHRLTTSAGGQDDGFDANGGLITAGGVGDSTANPANPYATDIAPRYDDELYNLAPLLNSGANTIIIASQNPSANDNVFFMGLTTKGTSVVHTAPDAGGTLMLLGTGLTALAALRRKLMN